MHRTKNDLPAAKREKLAVILNQLLADAIDLKLQTKQAHWNVKGENFIALHELFDKVATIVDDSADLIAERVMQLGGSAEGTLPVVSKRSRLKEYPLKANRHVDSLSSALAGFIAPARKAIDETDALGDKVTADILTGIVRTLDKELWFVESNA